MTLIANRSRLLWIPASTDPNTVSTYDLSTGVWHHVVPTISTDPATLAVLADYGTDLNSASSHQPPGPVARVGPCVIEPLDGHTVAVWGGQWYNTTGSVRYPQGVGRGAVWLLNTKSWEWNAQLTSGSPHSAVFGAEL